MNLQKFVSFAVGDGVWFHAVEQIFQVIVSGTNARCGDTVENPGEVVGVRSTMGSHVFGKSNKAIPVPFVCTMVKGTNSLFLCQGMAHIIHVFVELWQSGWRW